MGIFSLEVTVVPQPFILPETDVGPPSHPPFKVINKAVVVLLLKDDLQILHHWEVKFLLPPEISFFHPPYLESKILDQG